MKVMLIGLGNIGSALARLLVSMLCPAGDERHEIVLIDHDVYDPGNLATQIIDKDDVGRNKAVAQARRLRGLNPKLKVTAFPIRLEHLPLGVFADCDAIFTCLDSKAARVAANERIWKSGVAMWFDTGVSPDDRLARVSIYQPGKDAPCLECGWGEPEYASLEVTRPCGSVAAPSTGAPAALGCLAASIAALEFEKLLRGESDAVNWSKEIILSASAHTHLVTALKHDARCRFDHQTLSIENADVNVREVTLADFWSRYGANDGALRVEGGRWLTSLVCGSCRVSQPALAVRGRGLAEAAFCPACGSGRMVPSGFHQKDAINRAETLDAQLALPLCRLGIRPREVVTFIHADQTTRTLMLS